MHRKSNFPLNLTPPFLPQRQPLLPVFSFKDNLCMSELQNDLCVPLKNTTFNITWKMGVLPLAFCHSL